MEQDVTNPKFEQELRDLLNRHSMENGSNTPDYLLAEYLMGCLAAWERTTKQRDAWHGLKFNEPLNTTTP